jgi:DNA-binding CsgD family transcriptional regulator
MREWFAWLVEDDALRERLARLSAREREVLELLAAGHRVSDIVSDLDVAESTARSHIKAIRRKLGVGSQLAAVAALHRLGDGPLSPVDRPSPLLPSPRRG